MYHTFSWFSTTSYSCLAINLNKLISLSAVSLYPSLPQTCLVSAKISNLFSLPISPRDHKCFFLILIQKCLFYSLFFFSKLLTKLNLVLGFRNVDSTTSLSVMRISKMSLKKEGGSKKCGGCKGIGTKTYIIFLYKIYII